MIKDDRLGSAARGVGLFISAFALLNVAGSSRGGGFDGNSWWIDFRPLPVALGRLLIVLTAALLGAWAVRPRMSSERRTATVALLVVAAAVAAFNALTFYRLRANGVIATPAPVPFSLGVMLALLWILRRVIRGVRRLNGWWAAGALGACAVGFPLAQVATYGWTDYRRPADAIVVLGARAYADGTPSDALEDRVLTAVDLYRRGLAPRLIFSGGPGDGRFSEPEVMRRFAVDHGVPASAIVLDERGVTTDATVDNVARLLGHDRSVLMVSHGWHLPRVKMRCERGGLTAYTVPADERGQPLRRTPYLVAREVPALWWYYLRAVAG